MTRRPDRDPRAGSVLLSVLLWLAIVAAASGTGRLLTGFGWLVQLALAVGLVLAVPAAARALRAHPVLPPVLASLTAVVVVTAMFVPSRALLFLIPTPGAVAEAQRLAQSGFTSIAQQGLPAIADDGIAFLLVGGVVVLAWATDLFAFSVRLPALAGLFSAALLAVPAVIDPAEVSWSSLVVTVLVYAAILAVSARPERRPRPTLASAAPSIAVVGVVVLAAAILSGSAAGYVRTSASSGVSGTLFNGSIDPVVALGADLRRPDPVTVLRYATDSDLPVYLRVLTVSDFEGENWAPSDTEETAPIDAPIAPEGLAESVPRTTEEVDVSIETLRSQWLPVPYPVAALDGVGDGWLQDVQDGSIRGDATTRVGDDYDVETLRLEPDPQQLLDAPAATGVDQYLTLPDDVPAIVGTTAAEVTADDTNAYDRARSLQSFFRSSEFTYSEDTPAEEGYDGDGVGVLEAFLEVREGYCVHFASAMAVMAREIGIPSRLAIGYQPGSVVPSQSSDLTSYRVMSSDLHAWPELYFEGVGWLPFEPTPSRGAPASYTLPSATSSTGSSTPGAAATTAPGATPEASAAPTATAPTSSAAAGAAGATGTASAPVVTAWILLVLLLLVPWLLRVVQRTARRRASAEGSTEAAWSELLASARDLGVPVDATSTPRAQEALVAEAIGGDEQARGELRGLRRTLERVRYAPQASGSDSAWVAASRVVAALRADAGAPRRLFAAVLPRSALGALTRIRRPRSDL
ncbi:Transglutaminase-like superfamily protein [Rathayibacter oskolensis]|uniref:Transglutaminase-like superfamily protein n=1 Tax=Rathayibacter oskolensis TaxID=1891671 RepID=A0A1X7NDN7_9MICO|nr:DUF3488 and transglutaminase-like domain-containing protein [Rathayibacter oskolensis]SMH35386.1 Transglutaminase-like superfamily protein [Rathayibacter oskolensis]